MDSFSKPMTFGLGLAIGLSSTCFASYFLLNYKQNPKRKIETKTKSTQTLEEFYNNVGPSHLYLNESPVEDGKSFFYNEYFFSQSLSPTNTIASCSTSSFFFDVEPNLHFFKLYIDALDNLESIKNPRVIRTKLTNCESDKEFIAKVHCLRLAFESIFQDNSNRKYFINIGKEILRTLSSYYPLDQKECFTAYNELIDFVTISSNHQLIETEVATRSIPCLSFYDVVIDYVILDSFEDLDNPPQTVISVVKNQWMPIRFKEIAMKAAILAVLKFKKSKLVYKNGFFENFYNILNYILPILAWGFLGNNNDLTFKCTLIKQTIIQSVQDYFSFDRVRYTSLDDLIFDILEITKEHYDDLKYKLNLI